MSTLVGVVACYIQVAWVLSGIVLELCKDFGRAKPSLARRLFAELRPFYLLAVLVSIADLALNGEMLGWNTVFCALNLACWWIYKDADDDDRWKRRRRKVAEKVARLGGRLTVVPAESGAR